MLTLALLFTGYLSDTVGPFLCEVILKPDCAQACVNNANCSSFFYDVKPQECYLEKYVYVAMDQLLPQGGVQYYSLLNNTVGPSLSGATLKLECALACVNNASCSSFFYDVKTEACYLEKYVYVAMDQLLPQGGVQYYSLLNSACPASYIYSRFTNQCLRLHSSAVMKFPDAKTLCLENSGHLAFIRSEEENEQASIVAKNNTVWIGLERNDNDGEWHWSNGHSLGPYVNFHKQTKLEQIYGRMFAHGKWGAYVARGMLFALCEISVEGKDYALMC